jgi:hypothetical protein
MSAIGNLDPVVSFGQQLAMAAICGLTLRSTGPAGTRLWLRLSSARLAG